MLMRKYEANWGWLLIGLSALLTVLCAGGALVWFARGPWWMGMLMVALVSGCALFCIRGYTVTADAILIQRLFWSTRLPLAGLKSAQREQPSWWRGIRIGNGGFFSFTGWRWSPRLGLYRVFVTDPRQAISLRFANKIVILSPSDPEQFIHQLISLTGNAG
jgi:hypothetical protein